MNHCLVLAALVAALGEACLRLAVDMSDGLMQAARDGERSVTNQVGELQENMLRCMESNPWQKSARTKGQLRSMRMLNNKGFSNKLRGL